MIKKLTIYEDFKKVITTFQQPPFYEKLTEKDMMEEFKLYLDDKIGGCFAYYDVDDILGINCFTYGTDESHGIIFPNNDNIAYISGMATLEKARGMGIGTQLFEYVMNYFKEKEVYDYVYLRTNLYGSMSSGIAKKHDFITLQKDNQIYTQAVKFERIDPTVSDTDLRKFMVKKMNDNVSYSDIKFK